MTPNNNLSCLPFYGSLAEQNARKWWVYDRIYPLFAPAYFLLPFQFLMEIPNASNPTVYNAELINAKGEVVKSPFPELINHTHIVNYGDYYGVINSGLNLITSIDIPNGQYYLKLYIYRGVQYSEPIELYSEIFTVVNDINPYLKIEWWDNDDLVFDSGRIVFKENGVIYQQRLYLESDIAKPEYIFEDESESRDGFTFPIKQISKKKFKFSFIASEYMLDVMRFIRMADYIVITYKGQVYKPDSFLITPEWVDEGDVATVNAELITNTVVKKIGLGYIRPNLGDFNDDFNDDFNNNDQ